MKLYTSIGPNPRVVNTLLAEKGVEIPRVNVDIMAGEELRLEARLKRNPSRAVPDISSWKTETSSPR